MISPNILSSIGKIGVCCGGGRDNMKGFIQLLRFKRTIQALLRAGDKEKEKEGK